MERSRLNVIAAVFAALAIMGLVGIGVVALTYDASGGEPEYNENVFGVGLPDPAGGFYVIHDMHGGPPSAGEAARRSDLIARAAVTRQLESYWSTPDRKRPNLSEQELVMRPQYNIYTPYELRVKRVLKGEAGNGEVITLNRLGGRIGNDIVVLEHDSYSLTPGSEVVLFLRDCGEERANRFKSPGARFRIIDRYRLDKNGEPIEPGLTYDDLVGIVESEGTLKAKGGIIPC